MNKENELIWSFVQSDKNILKYLFRYNFETQDMSEYMLTPNYYHNMTPSEIDMIENTDWVFRFDIWGRVILGVDRRDDTVRCITNTGEVGIFCETFSLIPYEILRRDMLEEETTDDYFITASDFQKALLVYESWANKNNIELDKYNIYHNTNGELFKEYFEW